MLKRVGNYCFLISGCSKMVHQTGITGVCQRLLQLTYHCHLSTFILIMQETNNINFQTARKDDIYDRIGTIGLRGKTAHILIDLRLGCSLGDLCSQVNNLC